MTDVLDKIKAIKKKVKNGKLKLERKDIKTQLLKGIKRTDKERKDICKKAREKAHTITADTKRKMSNEIRDNLHSLSEGYDFIEESCGSGQPDFTFYEEPQISESISEAFADTNPYKMIGVAEGVFAPIGVMSRNNRIYDEDHYDYLLENQMLVDKIANRGMLGTIGHHDKKVDDEDLAEGKVSHIVTDLHIKEEIDGTRNLVGRLEILDTPAGHLLKTYYDSGMPLYVSSRGAGRLLNVANESYKRVDKTNYYLETFDIVRDPGFLGAKPKYVKESLEETKEDDNNIIGENNMDNKKVVPAVDTKMDAEVIINKLLSPLQEQLAELTETVKLLSDKVLDEDKAEVVEEVAEPVEEAKEESVVEEKVEEVAEPVEEACEKKEAKEAKEAKEEPEEAKEEVAEAVEETKAEEVSEEKKAEEAKKLEADAEEDDAKADKLKKDAEEIKEACKDKEEAKAEDKKDEEPVKEANAEKVSEECAVCAEPKKETETNENEKKIADPVTEECGKACADKEEDEAEAKKLEADAEEDKENAEEIKEGHGCGCDKEECHKHHEEEKRHHEECADDEHCDEAKEEAIDYEAKFKESEAVMNDLVQMVSQASERSKALVEKYEATVKELNAYKLSEELAITIDEAKEKLETKSYDEIVAEAKEEPAKVEEPVQEAKAEEPVQEAKKAVKSVFSRFSGLNESKKDGKKGFSIFG